MSQIPLLECPLCVLGPSTGLGAQCAFEIPPSVPVSQHCSTIAIPPSPAWINQSRLTMIATRAARQRAAAVSAPNSPARLLPPLGLPPADSAFQTPSSKATRAPTTPNTVSHGCSDSPSSGAGGGAVGQLRPEVKRDFGQPLPKGYEHLLHLFGHMERVGHYYL